MSIHSFECVSNIIFKDDHILRINLTLVRNEFNMKLLQPSLGKMSLAFCIWLTDFCFSGYVKDWTSLRPENFVNCPSS